jgi:hypothetical protein
VVEESQRYFVFIDKTSAHLSCRDLTEQTRGTGWIWHASQKARRTEQ